MKTIDNHSSLHPLHHPARTQTCAAAAHGERELMTVKTDGNYSVHFSSVSDEMQRDVQKKQDWQAGGGGVGGGSVSARVTALNPGYSNRLGPGLSQSTCKLNKK